jgi:lipoprotein-anchoring transpeptidase ErfK/SrfK
MICVLMTVAVSASVVAVSAQSASAQTNPAIPKTVDVAIATNRMVNVYNSPTEQKPSVKLDAFDNFSHRLVFRVLKTDGARLLVQLPVRPNGVTGYVNSSEMTVKTYDYAIQVDISDRKLTLYKGGVPVFSDKVAVGAPATPTPLGSFYLTELAKVKNAGSEYGTYAFGLSAFSDKITRFKGRPGQIGLHGTNKPKDIGKRVSHGCIRLNNKSITKLANTVPQGTLIEIVA